MHGVCDYIVYDTLRKNVFGMGLGWGGLVRAELNV